MLAGPAGEPPLARAPAPSVVGHAGNEPIIRVANDGTIFVAALQHLYRSVNGGVSFGEVSPPVFATYANLASDSTIAFSPDGRTLYMSFDWPYAGVTAICSTTTRGSSWTCDPIAVPAASDRQWLKALRDGRLLLSDDVALEEAMIFRSADPSTPTNLVMVPTDIPRAVFRGQFTEGWGPTAFDDRVSIVTQGGVLQTFSPEGTFVSQRWLDLTGTGLPMTGRDASGHFYGLSERDTSLTLVRILNGSSTVDRLPIPIAHKARLSGLAAGPTGRVVVTYYGDLTASTWAFFVAESNDAASAAPSWTIRQVSPGIVHRGAEVCWNCTTSDPNARFSGDLLSPTFAPDGVAHYVWMDDSGTLYAAHD